MIMDDNDSQMIFGDLGGLKLPDICFTGEEAPKNTTQETCPERGSNPGQLHDRRACYRLTHSGGFNYRIEREKFLYPGPGLEPRPLTFRANALTN